MMTSMINHQMCLSFIAILHSLCSCSTPLCFLLDISLSPLLDWPVYCIHVSNCIHTQYTNWTVNSASTSLYSTLIVEYTYLYKKLMKNRINTV